MSEFLVSTSVPLYKLDGVVELPPSKDTSSKVRANLRGWQCSAVTPELWRLREGERLHGQGELHSET